MEAGSVIEGSNLLRRNPLLERNRNLEDPGRRINYQPGEVSGAFSNALIWITVSSSLSVIQFLDSKVSSLKCLKGGLDE